MNNTVCIDWLSVTVKSSEQNPYHAVDEIIRNMLLMDSSQFSWESYGINKYNQHFSRGDIKLYFSIDEGGLLSRKMGIFIQLTGTGCRQYEEYLKNNENNWVELVIRLTNVGANFTRIDIANDIYDNSLDVQRIYQYCRDGLCISNSKKYEYHETGILENGELVGETINIGSKGSNSQQFGVYNKLMERKLFSQDFLNLNSWVRAELRLFGKKANEVAKLMSDRKPLKDIYFGIINSSYRFVLDDRHSKDKNKRRRETVKWWIDYLETKSNTSLKYDREKPTLKKTERFLNTQVSKSLAKVFRAREGLFGTDDAVSYLISLVKNGETKFTENDKKEIEQYIEEQRSSDYWA